MNSKTTIIIIVIALLLGGGLGGWYLLKQQNTDTQQTQEVVGDAAVTIVRTNDGYTPKDVTINKGDIVSFVNESDEYHWPASDLHPTHGVYPEFDPLRPVAPGEEWKFKFDQVGVWKYHDHIRANKTGTITVN